jgi:hypothetical protein
LLTGIVTNLFILPTFIVILSPTDPALREIRELFQARMPLNQTPETINPEVLNFETRAAIKFPVTIQMMYHCPNRSA